MGKEKPAVTHRLDLLKASIWRNKSTEGDTFYNVVFSRSYKDKDGNWHESDSFGYDDLLPLAKLANVAHSSVVKLREDDRAARKKSEGDGQRRG